MDFVKSKIVGVSSGEPEEAFIVATLGADGLGAHNVSDYVPSPEVAASLVKDFADSRNVKFVIALAHRAGVTDIQALLPASTVRKLLLEAIYVSEPGNEYPVVSDPDVVSALATNTVSGSLRLNFGRKEILGALRLVGILDTTRKGYRTGRYSLNNDDLGKSSAEDSLAALRILVRHSTKMPLPDDDEASYVQPSDLIKTMAAAIVPFASHPGLKGQNVSEPYADLPFWGVNHDRMESHVPRLQSLGIAAVCSLNYSASVPKNTLAPDGGWHCHLCGQGRQQAAPLCVCPEDGFSACARCAAAWVAAQTGKTAWVGPSGKPNGPSELQVRFEAVAEAARLAAPTTGFADLDPDQLEGWHSGPWASGGIGAITSPYVVYAILAALVGMSAPCTASPTDSAATAASGVSIENGKSFGLKPFLVPGGAVDRYIWSLPFLLRRFSCDANEAVFELDPGWKMLSEGAPSGAELAPDGHSATTDQPDTAVLSAKTAAAVFAAHPVFTFIEELREDAAASESKLSIPLPLLRPTAHEPDSHLLRRSYFSREESLAAAVESCCWLGVEACLSAGALATLVSLPVAMKLLHACARDGSGPAAGYGSYERFEVPPFPGVSLVGPLADASDDPLALHEGKDLELLRALLDAGASAQEDTEGEVPLVTALWLQRLDYLAIVAEFKPSPNLRDLVGERILYGCMKSVTHAISIFLFENMPSLCVLFIDVLNLVRIFLDM